MNTDEHGSEGQFRLSHPCSSVFICGSRHHPLPFVAVLIRQRYMSAVMYRTDPSPPQLQLAVLWLSGLTVPRCVPSGAMTSTPPGPPTKRLPSRSTFSPSGRPC